MKKGHPRVAFCFWLGRHVRGKQPLKVDQNAA
jgi:hypothetical protein